MHPRTHTDLVHSYAKVRKVHHIYEYVTLNFVYKQLNGFLPTIYNDCFIQTNHVHNHFTRQNTNLYIPQLNTNYGHNTTKLMGSI